MLRHACRIHTELRASCISLISKRFKGHSHWQNIRHTKGVKDREKMLLTSSHLRKIAGSINAKNGDTNPITNNALAVSIEQAKKDSVPVGTIENYLQKLKTSNPVLIQKVYTAPGNINLVIIYDGRKESLFRQAFNKVKRVNKFLLSEVPNYSDIFTSKGIIVSKAPSVDTTIVKAEEDAIMAGAEEVEEVESVDKEEKVFQFVTLHEDLWTVVKSLREMGWTMYEHKHELMPVTFAELTEEELEKFNEIFTQIENIPEVESVKVNLA